MKYIPLKDFDYQNRSYKKEHPVDMDPTVGDHLVVRGLAKMEGDSTGSKVYKKVAVHEDGAHKSSKGNKKEYKK